MTELIPLPMRLSSGVGNERKADETLDPFTQKLQRKTEEELRHLTEDCSAHTDSEEKQVKDDASEVRIGRDMATRCSSS